MIGWGIYHKYILPGKKMVDRTLSGSKATYIAYLQQKEDDKVIVKQLTQNLNSARKLYLSLFQGQKPLYKCGVIGHTQKHEWLSPVSAFKGANKNIDVWKAIATYAQTELDLYNGEALSEKDAKIVTKK
jgi:iron uptake system EfeUOB component EfeO/EfeM